MSQDARRDEEVSTQRRARILSLPYFDTSQVTTKRIFKDILSLEEIQKSRVIPLQADAHNIAFGITNMTSQQTITGIRQRFLDHRLSFALISDAGYREYLKLYDPPKQIQYQDIAINTAGSKELQDNISSILEQVRADDMLAYLIQQAHRLGASDIHLENQPKFVRIRFRMDGMLHTIARLSFEKFRVLKSAVASAANISTASEEAQQGHIAQRLKMADSSEVDVNVRLETVQTINGMDMVMRLFNMNQQMYSLDRLGLAEDERQIVDDIIAKPGGLVLVVGPTGSGKTTTLYSMLNSLNTEERKIITIEDPVEYQFAGISQISVTTKSSEEISFAEKLRAILRLDPDIVMVGEVRDMDTAKTALQASMTGHLVLSTFHASSAAAAMTRLADVAGHNPLFVSAIRLVMAQRLVRRLDEATKQPYQPDQNTLQTISAILENLPSHIEHPGLNDIQLYRPGSSSENPYGYSGQIALREQFMLTDELRHMLEHSTGVLSADEIESAAVRGGMRTMLQDGMLKVLAGETTIEEVLRVVG